MAHIDFPDTDDELAYPSYCSRFPCVVPCHDAHMSVFSDTDDELAYPSCAGPQAAPVQMPDYPLVTPGTSQDTAPPPPAFVMPAVLSPMPSLQTIRTDLSRLDNYLLHRHRHEAATARLRHFPHDGISLSSFDGVSGSMFSSTSSDDEESDSDSDCSTVPGSLVDELIEKCEDSAFDDASEEVCTICLDANIPDRQACQFPGCTHTFHRECLAKWLRRRARCPNCRTHISGKAESLRDQLPAQRPSRGPGVE